MLRSPNSFKFDIKVSQTNNMSAISFFISSISVQLISASSMQRTDTSTKKNMVLIKIFAIFIWLFYIQKPGYKNLATPFMQAQAKPTSKTVV